MANYTMLIIIISTPHKLQSSLHSSDKNVHKAHNNNNQVNEVTGQTRMLKGTKS